MQKLVFIFIFLTTFSSSVFAGEENHEELKQPADCPTELATPRQALSLEFALKRLLVNVSPADATPGAIVAAQTRANPNYYYHWVRDAGLVVESLLEAYKNTNDPAEKKTLKKVFRDYTNYSYLLQKLSPISGLGEPKFNVDGTTFDEVWGRPQTDSPAIRASSLIEWAKILTDEGDIAYIRNILVPIIQNDLIYVNEHWTEKTYDLWEEVKGHHFYTRMVQRRALLDGAELLLSLGLKGEQFAETGKVIEATIATFWNDTENSFMTYQDPEGRNTHTMNLDTSIILGLLHGDRGDGFLPFSDARVQATLKKLIATFTLEYPINSRPHPIPGIAIGRYPGDHFAGSFASPNSGNPWVLCTLAVAEAYYRTARELRAQGKTHDAKQALDTGDTFLERVKYHANQDGSLNEQIDRSSGFLTSVQDLTWNYAALITTLIARP